MPIFLPNTDAPACGGRRSSAIFQNTANGRVIRAKVKPIRKRSSKASQARVNLLGSSSAWRNLSPAEQADWVTAAQNFPQHDACGNEYFLTGQQLFLKGNLNLTHAGTAINTTPPSPTVFVNLQIEEVTISIDLQSIELTVDPPNVSAGQRWNVYFTPPVSAGISTPAESLYIGFGNFEGGENFFRNFYFEYLDQFGQISEKSGMKIFGRLIQTEQDSGITGNSAFQYGLIP